MQACILSILPLTALFPLPTPEDPLLLPTSLLPALLSVLLVLFRSCVQTSLCRLLLINCCMFRIPSATAHSEQLHSPVLLMTSWVSFLMMLGRGEVDGLLSAECLTHISHLLLVLCPVLSLCINYYLLQEGPYLIKTESITNRWASTNI